MDHFPYVHNTPSRFKNPLNSNYRVSSRNIFPYRISENYKTIFFTYVKNFSCSIYLTDVLFDTLLLQQKPSSPIFKHEKPKSIVVQSLYTCLTEFVRCSHMTGVLYTHTQYSVSLHGIELDSPSPILA